MDWGPIIAAVVSGGSELIGGLIGNDIATDEADLARSDAKQARMDSLYLEMLKAKYLGGQGGGGGGGINPNMLTKAQKLAATQNIFGTKIDSINSIIGAYQNAMGVR